MEGWRAGGMEGSYPCSQRASWQGHHTVSCPSHHSNPKIHISQPYWPKPFPSHVLPSPGVSHLSTFTLVVELPFIPSSFSHFFLQAEQM